MSLANTTQESLNLVKGQINDQIGLGQTDQGFNNLQKSITTALGLTGYNLEAPAKQLVVFKAPIRKTIPRKIESTGTVVHWKVITGVTPSGPLSTIEGERGSSITTTLSDKSVTMKSCALQDSVTLEAVSAGRNYQDPKATAHTNLLLRLMTQEEIYILFANGSTALTATTAPTVTLTAAAGSLASGTYHVYVAALNGVAANRVVLDTQKAALVLGVQAYDSNLSATSGAFDGVTAASSSVTSATITGTASGKLYASCTAVKGAFAYAWFVGTGTAGTETLQIVTSNSYVTLTALVTSGTTVASCTADGSADSNIWDGVVAQTIAGGGYYYDAGYTQLTQAKAGVKEIDDFCAYLYSNWKIGPTRAYCGYQFFKDVTDAVVGTTGAPIYYQADTAQARANLVLGVRVASYINKYTGEAFTLEVHPWIPGPSCIIFTDEVPYENANIPNVLEMGLGYDYMAIEYAMTKPKYEFETRFFGALKHYFPGAFAILTNFKSGLQ